MTHGPAFTMLVGTLSHPSDPSANIDPKVIKAHGWTTQQLKEHPAGGGLTGGIVPDAPKPTLQGVITVDDNDFSTGQAQVTVGERTIVAGLDYLVGGSVDATATNLAAVLDAIPGISAAAVGPDVTVDVPYMIGQVDFLTFHLGTITNFLLSPTTGSLSPTAAVLSPPVF